MKWMSLTLAALLCPTTMTVWAVGESDADKIQGTWQIVSASYGGKEYQLTDPQNVAKIEFKDGSAMTLPATYAMTIKDGKLSFGKGDPDGSHTYTLDATKKPKHLNLLYGMAKEKTAWIYQLEGNLLKVGWTPMGPGPGPRPTGFDGKTLTLTFKRAGSVVPPAEDVKKAETHVKEFLAKIKGEDGQILYLGNDYLNGIIPGYKFFAVRYRVYPVTIKQPEGMNASNVFAVSKEGKAEYLKDAKALENFFRGHLVPVKGEAAARLVLKGWLTLSQEFHQDGFYKFELPKDGDMNSFAGGIAGRAVVMAGGNGEIHAALTFENGKLAEVEEASKIKRGPRPRCHATKLLDADPIVRQICEDDLLYMGRPALDYLREQRELAGTKLRREIDRVIERILREEE